MRGAVTLAAVFVLPEETPHREVLVMIALVVVAGTLLVQGSTLPVLVRRLGLHGPDPAQDLLLQARVQQDASNAGLRALDEVLTGAEPPEVVERLRQHSFERANRSWELLGNADETPSQTYARLRAHMLEAERASVLEARDSGTAPDDVLRQVLRALDVEEAILIRVAGADSGERESDLAAPLGGAGRCEHLVAVAGHHPEPTSQGCEECLREGLTWVHLRLCLTCGHVGCCDSSIGKHATAHFHRTGHPVMRSFEPGEAWRWCYVDELMG
jgi:CPA1 family monovalent cation:H+ antiporter